MKKKFTLLCLLFLWGVISHSQSPANVSGHSLWIKNNSKENSQREKPTTLNFNPALILSEQEKTVIDKNKLKSKFTLFLVYQSNAQNQTPILNYRVGNQSLKISNSKVESSLSNSYTSIDSKSGVIVEYSADFSVAKKSNICILNLLNQLDTKKTTDVNALDKTALFEFIYYPRILSSTEKLKIETYLSIKYGVSLIGNKNYVSANQTKVWSFDQNAPFTHNVTGIAREDASGLFQKQSGNATLDGLYIGFGNYQSLALYTKDSIKDKTYLVWADNQKDKAFKTITTDQTTTQGMDRVWKIQKTTSEKKTALKGHLLLKAAEFFDSSNESAVSNDDTIIWLVVNPNSSASFDYQKATYYPSKAIANQQYLFEHIIWDGDYNGSDSFTFIKAPANLFVNTSFIASNCALGKNAKIDLKIIGGQEPFEVKIAHDKGVSFLEKTKKDLSFEVTQTGVYTLTVTDQSKQTTTQTISIPSLEGIECSLNSKWYLDENSKVEITPTVNASQEKLEYTWWFENTIIAKEKTLQATQEGNYTLRLKNSRGCEKTIAFDVVQSLKDQKIALYPNPLNSNESFHIQFDFKTPTAVQIKTYGINGALLQSRDLEKVTDYTYTQSIQTSGTYLVTVTTDQETTTFKLLVK